MYNEVTCLSIELNYLYQKAGQKTRNILEEKEEEEEEGGGGGRGGGDVGGGSSDGLYSVGVCRRMTFTILVK